MNWQLTLNIAGFIFVYFAGTYANDFAAHRKAGETWSCIFSGSLTCCFVGLAAMVFHIALLNPARSHSLKSLLFSYFLYHVIFPTMGRLSHRKRLKEMQDPQKHQDELLMEILEENSQTAFGRDHGLAELKSAGEFRSKFPLTDFSFYEKYVDRIAEGEEGVMTKAKVIHLSVTSGTTGRNKMYPLTDRDRPVFVKIALALMYNSVKEQGLGMDRELAFRLSNPVRKSSGGLTIGGLTAARKPVNFSDIMPKALSKVMKERPSFFIQALFGIKEKDIGMIQGYSSDLMYSFFKSMEHNKEKIALALENGHIEPFPELDEDVREELNKCLTADPDRAEEIRDIFAEGSVGLAKRLWPKVTFCNMVRTGGFRHSATILENSYIKGISYGIFLHAGTEGVFGVGMSREDMKEEICTFLPGSVYYEFIKEEEREQDYPRTYLLSELDVGQTYEIVITNWHGLYRNRFGDVVKIVGYTNNCPKYIFQYRTGQILNCGLDRTTEQSFYEALADSEKEWNLKVQNYTSTESFNLEAANGEKYGRNHYVGFLEFEKGVALTKQQHETFEANLCKKQESYAEFRGVNSLGPVALIQVQPGTFDGLREIMFGDRPNMQFKTPRVIRSQELLTFLWKNRILSS